MEHTRGPWRWSGNAIVADVGKFDYYYGGELICESVESRNIALIVAAPVLLDLLKRAVEGEGVSGDEIRAAIQMATASPDDIKRQMMCDIRHWAFGSLQSHFSIDEVAEYIRDGKLSIDEMVGEVRKILEAKLNPRLEQLRRQSEQMQMPKDAGGNCPY